MHESLSLYYYSCCGHDTTVTTQKQNDCLHCQLLQLCMLCVSRLLILSVW